MIAVKRPDSGSQRVYQRLFGILVIVILAMAGGAASAAPMTFRLEGDREACQKCRFIIADGTIEADTDLVLLKFIEASELLPDDVIVLRSPGGSLVGGMKLGKLIRSKGLSTHVGSVTGIEASLPASENVCASACSYAFLGGFHRSIAPDGKLGLHRFSLASDDEASVRVIADLAQTVVSDIFKYVADMGVDQAFVTRATATEADDMIWPDYSELLKLRAVNASGPYPDALWEFFGPTYFAISETRSDGSKDAFMLDCLWRQSPLTRPVTFYFIQNELAALSPDIPSYGQKIGVSISERSADPGSVGSVQGRKGSFDHRTNDFTVTFEVGFDEMLRLARTANDLELTFEGQADLLAVTGKSVPVPGRNLFEMLTRLQSRCGW